MTITFALQASQIMRQIGFILTSLLLAKSGLSVGDIGVFETLFFVGTSLSYFWLNGLIQSLLAFMPTVSSNEKQRVYFSISLIFMGLSVLLFLILKLFPSFILSTLTSTSTLPYFDIFTLYLLFNAAPFFLEGFWAVEEDPLSIFVFSSISNLILPFAIVVPLWFGYGFDVSFYGLLSVALVRFAWFLVVLIKNQSANIHFPQLKAFIKLSLPTMAYSLLNGFTLTFVFWIVGYYLAGNVAEFAIFRFGAREFPLVLALTTGLSNAFVPVLAVNFNQQVASLDTAVMDESKNPKLIVSGSTLTTLKKKTERLWHILFPSSIALMCVSKMLFPLVFSPAFARSSDIFTLFLLLLSSRALFPQTILLALNQTKTLLWIAVLETLTIVGLGFLGVFWLGTEGAVGALIFGFLVEKIAIILVLKHRYSIDFQSYTNAPLYFSYLAALILSYCIQM